MRMLSIILNFIFNPTDPIEPMGDRRDSVLEQQKDAWMGSHDEHIEKPQIDASHLLTTEETKSLRKMSSHLNLDDTKLIFTEANKLKEEESMLSSSPRQQLHTKSQLTENHASAFGSAMRTRSENHSDNVLAALESTQENNDNDEQMKNKSSSSSGIFCCSSERNSDSDGDNGDEGCTVS